jgi:hypothetical protein
MSNLCFDACVSLPYLTRLFGSKLPFEMIEAISGYTPKKSLSVMKQLFSHYSPKPQLQSLEEGKEYLALKTVDNAYNGCVFQFLDHEKRMDGAPVIMQVRSMIETDRLESDRDFHLAQAAVLRYYWTDKTRIWETLSVEMMCFFFFFGGLGGHITLILEILEGAPPRKKNTLTMFALLGFLHFQDCSVALPKVELWVVQRLTAFLQGQEQLCTRASP